MADEPTQETPEQALARLRASPPRRRGYPVRQGQGWSGESAGAFAQRQAAWEAAIAREEASLAQARARARSG